MSFVSDGSDDSGFGGAGLLNDQHFLDRVTQMQSMMTLLREDERLARAAPAGAAAAGDRNARVTLYDPAADKTLRALAMQMDNALGEDADDEVEHENQADGAEMLSHWRKDPVCLTELAIELTTAETMVSSASDDSHSRSHSSPPNSAREQTALSPPAYADLSPPAYADVAGIEDSSRSDVLDAQLAQLARGPLPTGARHLSPQSSEEEPLPMRKHSAPYSLPYAMPPVTIAPLDMAGKQKSTNSLAIDERPREETDDEDDASDDDDEDDAYSITWEHGPLGLAFRANLRGATVIRRVNRKTGTAIGLQYARAGDVLVAINGAPVAGRSTADIMEQLQAPCLPLRLDFQPVQLLDVEDNASRGSGDALLGGAGGSNSGSNRTLKDLGGRHELPPQIQQVPTVQQVPAIHQIAVPSTSDVSTDYEVIWTGGPLGCALKAKNGLPVIKSVVPNAPVEPSVAQISDGDMLLEVNGINTEAIGFRAVVSILQTANKPIRMRFRRSHEDRSTSTTETLETPETNPSTCEAPEQEPGSKLLGPNQYTVDWLGGPLGIQIKGSSDGNVIVSKYTGNGDPRLTGQIGIGDVLVQIGDVAVKDAGVGAAFELLRHVAKPVTLMLEKLVFQVPEFTPTESVSSSFVPNLRDLRRKEKAAAAKQRESGNSQQGGMLPPFRQPRNSGQSRDQQLAARIPPMPSDSDVVEWIDAPADAQQPKAESASIAHDDVRVPTTEPIAAPADVGALDAEYRPSLPRFSEIEAGRVMTTPIDMLPPPPAYDDIFAPKALDREQPQQLEPPAAPPMPPLPQQPLDPFIDYDDFAGADPMPQTRQSSVSSCDSEKIQQLRLEHMKQERLKNQAMERDQDAAIAEDVPTPTTAAAAAPQRQELWVQWNDGPLGITFRRSRGQIVVSRLTGAGHSAGLDRLYPGDWLMRFGNEGVGVYLTKDLRLSETVAIIKRLPKPVDMWFITQ